MKAEAGVGVNLGVFEKLLSVFAKLQGEIRVNAHSEQTMLATLRKRPADLLIQANAVIAAVSAAIPDGRHLLIVVEDLDKNRYPTRTGHLREKR